jgi:hypothetical protein
VFVAVVGKINVEDFRGKKQVTKKLRPANRWYTVNKKKFKKFFTYRHTFFKCSGKRKL